MADSFAQVIAAVGTGTASDVRALLQKHPEVAKRIDEPHPQLPFDSTLLLAAVRRKDREIIDVLLEAGADINARSRWWAGGFGVLDGTDDALASFLIERGARVDANAAAHLGKLDALATLIGEDPSCVHARGGDGQTPLHVAATVEIAALLLDHGADIDALDVDHESTPAQYLVRERPEVARYLVDRGARTDILLTAALGDLARTRAHLEGHPSAIHTSVSDRFFPKRNPHSGGTIYHWTLGGHKTPHVVAREFGHEDVYRMLMEASAAGTRLVVACALGDQAEVRAILGSTPSAATTLTPDERARLTAAAQSNEREPVRLMIESGWPLDLRGGEGGTALHWAAWHGNAAMVGDLLRGGADVEARDWTYNLTPVGWALHGSLHSWHRQTGDYGATVEAFAAAGATLPAATPELAASDAARAALLRSASS